MNPYFSCLFVGFFCEEAKTKVICPLGRYCPAGSEVHYPCYIGHYCPHSEDENGTAIGIAVLIFM